MMKKINKNDLFYSLVKTYPKVSFFANNGVVRFDRNDARYRDSEKIFDFLTNIPPEPEVIPPPPPAYFAESFSTSDWMAVAEEPNTNPTFTTPTYVEEFDAGWD